MSLPTDLKQLIDQILSFTYVRAAVPTATEVEVKAMSMTEDGFEYTTVYRVAASDLEDATTMYEDQGWEQVSQAEVIVPHTTDDQGRPISVVRYDLTFRRPLDEESGG